MIILEAGFWQLLLQQLQHTSFLEWVGFVSTIACIYLAAKENIWNWPVSVVSIVVSAYLYFNTHLFGDFALQFYFLFTAFYGWWFWLKKKKDNDKPIATLNKKQWWLVVFSVVFLTMVLGFLLDRYTPSNVAYEDGFCTAVSLVAQFMLTRKILENWILWIVVDICYIPLLLNKGLNLYAVLYAILVVIAIKGYIDWRKTYREQAN
jgi:nicotinamide mononucleotide transporter